MTDAIFRQDRGLLVPGPDSCGPWSQERMHGGPVFGLIARAIEAAAPDPTLVPCRYTFDLSRAVPLVPLEVHTHIAQQSSRLCLMRASLRADGAELVTATALLLRESDAGESIKGAPRPAGPEGIETQSLFGAFAGASAIRGPGYHVRVETRWVPRAEGAAVDLVSHAAAARRWRADDSAATRGAAVRFCKRGRQPRAPRPRRGFRASTFW